MFNWNDQHQAGFLLWDKHRKNEDHILRLPTNEGNALLTFGDGDIIDSTRSMVETCGAKHDFLNCNVEKRCGNSFQGCNDSSLEMDAWSDFPYLGSVLDDGFNDGSDQDAVVTELMNDLSNASNLYSGVEIMTRYNNYSEPFPNKGLSSLSEPCSLSTGDAMQRDDELELFGDDDRGNDSFLDYDWANIEDLDDLDDIFKNHDSFDRNEKVHSANSFHNTSADLNSNTSQSITVPVVPTYMEQTCDTGSPYYELSEYSDANVNSLLTKKEYEQSQSWRSQEEEKGKSTSFQGLDYSYSSERQPISSSQVQGSNVNSSQIIQSPPLGEVSFSHGAKFPDYEYPTPLSKVCVESNHHKSTNGGFKANPNHSNNHKISNKTEAVVPKATIMSPRKKIEKLKQRQKMQAILAIQKEREQYDHQIYSTEDNVSQDATTSMDTMEEYKQKESTPEVSYLEEQCQSEVTMSSLTNGRSVEEAIYHQLQYNMQKLDSIVRLNIRDSLFRLARNAMERSTASDRSCTDNNKDEYEISINEESNNHDRSSSMPDSERVTNPIDRIVADLLFQDSSVPYLLPIGEGNVPMTTSIGTW